MIFTAVICTLLAGFFASFIGPSPLANSIPAAVMGGFILYAIQHPKTETSTEVPIEITEPDARDIDSDFPVTESMKRQLGENCAKK